MDSPRGSAVAVAVAVAVALAVMLAVTGCSAGSPPFDPASPMAGLPVRTDPEPIRKSFPELGNVVEVHWQSRNAGPDFALGPSDVLIEALVVLDPADFAAITEKYPFEPSGTGWDFPMSDRLRPFARDPGDWRHNGDFEAEVGSPNFTGKVFVEMETRTVHLRLSTG